MEKVIIANEIGKKYGRWTIIAEGSHKHYLNTIDKHVICKCDCGVIKNISLGSIRQGKSTSCGCYNKEFASKNNRTHGYLVGLNGGHTPEYEIWIKMKGRCFNPSDKNYNDYGARGITVCERWQYSFPNFISDMGVRPSKDFSIERVDVDGNYEPSNCKWLPLSLQNRNKRNSVRFTLNGETMGLTEWCRDLKLSYSMMRHRVFDLKIPFEEAITYPKHVKLKKKYENK